MSFLSTFKKAIQAFEACHQCTYCLIGGHAASLYRAQERLTKDIGFAIVSRPVSEGQKYARQIIKHMGYKPVLGFVVPHDAAPNRKRVCMVTTAPLPGELKGIIDILLPELAWVENAVARAQHNKIDFGFSHVPVITPEDLIVAKCFALRDAPDRFQDLDDIREIFGNENDLDLDYLREQMRSHSLTIPEVLKKYVPLGFFSET